MDELSKRLPLNQLEKTQEYQRLTQKQRLWVATYCEGGLADGNYDPIAATRTAYQCKSAEVARIMSYSITQNIRIVAALNRHFNTEPIEDFLRTLDRAVHNKKLTMAQLGALKLKCDILGIGNRIPNHKSVSDIPADVIKRDQEAQKTQKKKKNAVETSTKIVASKKYF